MASIEIVDFNKWKTEQTNISHRVGTGEINDKNDVLLIQTLIKLVGFSDHKAREKFGLAKKDLPEPTGAFDRQTMKAIWGYQRKMAHRLLKIDGKVHPASYKDRLVKKVGTARLMMITLLNLEAIDEALITYKTDLIPAIKQISPNIVFIP